MFVTIKQWNKSQKEIVDKYAFVKKKKKKVLGLLNFNFFDSDPSAVSVSFVLSFLGKIQDHEMTKASA